THFHIPVLERLQVGYFIGLDHDVSRRHGCCLQTKYRAGARHQPDDERHNQRTLEFHRYISVIVVAGAVSPVGDLHSMISSALAMSVRGTDTPSALAVLRLIVNSNVVG